MTDASIARALEIEAEIHHDLMAEVRAFAEQCPVGGGIIHLGATSMDIEDNADALRLREALDLIIESSGHLTIAMRRDRSSATPTCRPWPSPTCSRPSRPRWATAWRSICKTC